MPAQIKVAFVLWKRFFSNTFYSTLVTWKISRFRCASLSKVLPLANFCLARFVSRLYKPGPRCLSFRWTDDGWNDPKPIVRIIRKMSILFFQIDQTRFQAQYHLGIDSCGGQGMEKTTPQSYFFSWSV